METILITRSSLRDLDVLQRISRETFFESFAQSNSEEDMRKYLDENVSTEKIRTELNNPESSFFIAWQGETPAGYIKLNTGNAQTVMQDERALEIERIYVKAEYQGKKLGQMLYEKALEIAQTEKKPYIWLGVWEENPRAINFYKRKRLCYV
jgi:ribosomal protein S18 acetylase RimI-like enzyme